MSESLVLINNKNKNKSESYFSQQDTSTLHHTSILKKKTFEEQHFTLIEFKQFLIDKVSLNHLLNEDFEEIYNKLDIERKGYITLTQIESLLKSKRYSIKNHDFLISKAEKAIYKLKKIESKLDKNDTESILDINWIIKQIINNRWDESDIKLEETTDENNAYNQYSSFQSSINIKKDFKKINCRSNKNLLTIKDVISDRNLVYNNTENDKQNSSVYNYKKSVIPR